MYLGKKISVNNKAHISANKLIAGGPPNLAMIIISQKNLIIGCTLSIPILRTKLREFDLK